MLEVQKCELPVRVLGLWITFVYVNTTDIKIEDHAALVNMVEQLSSNPVVFSFILTSDVYTFQIPDQHTEPQMAPNAAFYKYRPLTISLRDK